MLRSMHAALRCLSGSRDTSQGVWVWLLAVVWLLDFVARLVRQLGLILPNFQTREIYYWGMQYIVVSECTLVSLNPWKARQVHMQKLYDQMYTRVSQAG